MTRMIRGSVLLAACVGLWSCSSDPTADEAGVPYKIVALPSSVIIKQDSAQLIEFQLVDQLDGQIPEQWTITANSPNFSVDLDSTYRVVYNTDGTLTLPDSQTQVRATITGTSLGNSSFTVSAGGKSLVIPVSVAPGVLNATFTPANPAPGDTVTVTLPAGLLFTPTSVVFFPGNDSVIVVSRAADSTSIRFISAPSTDTTANISKVFNTNLPTVTPVNLVTAGKLVGSQSSLLPNGQGPLPVTISDLTPDATPITATLAAQLAFTDSTKFSFPDQAPPSPTSVSPDSSTATLTVFPNVSSPLRATNFIFRGAPQFKYAAVSANDVVSTIVVANVPATFVPSAPVWGDTVTITIGAGYKLSPTSVVTWGANGLFPARTVSIAADSSSMKVLPLPGSDGVATITNVLGVSYPGFAIKLPTTATMVKLTHSSTTDPATAPTVLRPGFYYDDGKSVTPVCLAGGTSCSFYKLVVSSTATITFTFRWTTTFSTTGANNTTDMGMYFLNSSLTSFVGTYGCDSRGGGASAQPETCTATFAAGTYYIEADNYGATAGASPQWLTIQMN